MAKLEVPEWISDAFVSEVLETDGMGEVELLGWRCQKAILQGIPSLSHMYRVTIEYRRAEDDPEKRMSVIVKAPLGSGRFRGLSESIDIYGREATMYYWYLPRTYDIHWSRITPRAYDCSLEDTVVLEDLTSRGYKMANRFKQLDKDHCRQTLISLARFHAISIAMQQKEPDLKNTKEEEETAEKSPKKFSKFFILRLVDFLKEIAGCEKYVDIIEDRLDNIHNSCLLALRSKPEFRVLNHGDLWTENILFRYNEEGDVDDAKLIDLQFSHFGSFAYDLMIFWWTSANEEVREHCKEELFHVYRQTLNENLQELGVKRGLTEEKFAEELRTFAPFSIQVISHMLAVVMENTNSRAQPHPMLTYTEEYLTKTSNFRYNHYKVVLPKILKHAEEFGAFL